MIKVELADLMSEPSSSLIAQFITSTCDMLASITSILNNKALSTQLIFSSLTGVLDSGYHQLLPLLP